MSSDSTPADQPAAADSSPAARSASEATAEIARVLAAKHLELSTKGYTEAVIAAALKRSLNYAEDIGLRIEAQRRPWATVDLLKADLVHAEAWCEGYVRAHSE